MSTPTRFPAGVTNNKPSHPLAGLPVFDPAKGVDFFDDFLGFTVAAANITGWHRDGSGTGATVILDAHGGLVQVTTDTTAGAGSNEHYQHAVNTDVVEPFLIQAGKRAALSARFKVSTALQCLPIIGLHNATDDPWNAEPTDQFYFRTLAANRDALGFACGKTNATEQVISLGDLVDDTFVRVYAYYDGKNTVHAYRLDDAGAVIASGSIDVSDTTAGDLLPDTELTPAFGMETGDTSTADVLTVDWLFVWSDR